MTDFYIPIGILSSFVWFLVPFFQRKSKYFYYFTILGSSGLYGLLFFILPIGIPSRTLLAVSTLLIPALYRGFFHRHVISLLVLGALLYAAAYFVPIVVLQKISLLNFAIVESILLSQIFIDATAERTINIFFVLTTLYGFLTIIKFIFLIKYVESGLPFYFTATLIQVMIGVFFIFKKEDSPRLLWRIKTH